MNKTIDISKTTVRKDSSNCPLLIFLTNSPKDLSSKESHKNEIAWFEDGRKIKNYIQTFRTDSFNSEYEEKGKEFWYGKKAEEHLKDIDRALWYGIKKYPSKIFSPGTSKMGGIMEFLEKEKRTFRLKKGFSMKEFNNFLREGFRNGADSKVLFVDKKSFKYLNEMYKDRVEKKKYTPSESYCFDPKNIFKLVSVFGTIHVIKTPVLASGMLCLIDLSNVYYRYLHNRDTLLISYKDSKLKYSYITECSLMLSNFKNHLLGIMESF